MTLLREEGKFDDIAHSSITVFKVQLLAWPGHHLKSEQLHPDIQERHVDNFGEWLILYKTEEFRNGVDRVGRVWNDNPLVLFALEIRGLERHLSSINKDYSPAGEERELR